MKKKLTVLNASVLAAGAALFVNYENNGVDTTEYILRRPDIGAALDGMKILQISDLQNKRFGKYQKILAAKILKAHPDVIVITGDIIDRRTFDIEPARELVRVCVRIAPVLFVPGNHEIWSGRYDEVKRMLISEGVDILENRAISFEYRGETINFCGISDPCVLQDGQKLRRPELVKESLHGLIPKDGFSVLLSHRPEFFADYELAGAKLVFTGHVHGGQFRIPPFGALYAPDQGILPAYSAGIQRIRQCDMIVSRGLGNSSFPLRLFNRPELVLVRLKK